MGKRGEHARKVCEFQWPKGCKRNSSKTSYLQFLQAIRFSLGDSRYFKNEKYLQDVFDNTVNK